MAIRPLANELNRDPGWELVDILQALAAGNMNVIQQNALITVPYDYIALTYTGNNLTGVVYKTGGAGGATVATLALAYTGSRLDSVTKT